MCIGIYQARKALYIYYVQSGTVANNIIQGQGQEFHMKYHNLHDFSTSTPFEEKSSDHFRDLHELKLLINFDVNLTSFLGGVKIPVLNVKFIPTPGEEVRLT